MVGRVSEAPDFVVAELATLSDLEQAAALFGRLWQEPDGSVPLSAHVLRALQLSGNYVAGAFAGPGGQLIGASAGWATPPPVELHSHVTGVEPGLFRKGVGLALKLHQRNWALERGIGTIAWTFDPLVLRNARFNLARLGATVAAYLPNIYGSMEDALNCGSESDRLLARWELNSPSVNAAATGEPVVIEGERRSGLESDALGRPAVDRGLDITAAMSEYTVEVPSDIEALRLSDPEVAALWRTSVRDVLGGALSSGAAVIGLDARGRYVVAR